MSCLAYRFGLQCWMDGGGGTLTPLLSVQYSLSYDLWRGGGKIVTLKRFLLTVVSCISIELST